MLALIFTLVFFFASMTMLRHWGRPPYDFRAEFLFTYTRYLDYIYGIITAWNWGRTGTYNENVWDFAWRRMWVTTRLNLIALALYMSIGIALGLVSALKRNSVFDKTVSVMTMVLGSIPHFILMYLLVIFLAVRNRWLPYMFPGFHTENPWTLVVGLMIPMLSLCLGPIFKFTRLVRGEFLEAQHDDYLLICKTKGLSKNQALKHHAFRNCMVPVMPELTPTSLYVLGGSFFVELIYGIDGVARLMFQSMIHPFMDFYIIRIDIPMAMVSTMFYAAFGMLFALIIDVAYPLVDPRIRIGATPTDMM